MSHIPQDAARRLVDRLGAAAPHPPIAQPQTSPEVTGVMASEVYFNWSWPGIGFGQLSLSMQDGKVVCGNECMGRGSVRSLLRAFADHIAATATLEDEQPLPEPPKEGA